MTKKLNGLLDTLIDKREETKRKSIFHYSSYWGTWNRTLISSRLGIQPELAKLYTSVELDLTPINSYEVSNWPPLKEFLFRQHCTSPDRKDEDCEALPEKVHARMIEMYGNTIVNRMLTEDFLSLIDLEKLRHATNGGIPLAHILKDDFTAERYKRAQDLPRYCDCGISHAPSNKQACAFNCGNCGCELDATGECGRGCHDEE